MPVGCGDAPVQLWYCATDSCGPAALAAAMSVLSTDERERHDRLVFARDRRDYAMAHALLRRALARRAGRPAESWTFERSARGKPSLRAGDPTPLAFSLSHADGMVACVVGEGEDIGVDVAVARPGPHSSVDLAEGHFAAAEVASLLPLPALAREQRFIELWALKEAFAKAVGVGLSDRLDAMAFDLSVDGSIGFSPPAGESSSAWYFELFAPTVWYRIAIARRCTAGQELCPAVARTESDPSTLSPLRTSDRRRAR